MEPRIQYAKTSDGVQIAFTAFGESLPLIVAPTLVASHLQMNWQIPSTRACYEQLAQRARVIRYDCRGAGMSQRDALDFSLDARLRDLEAVADRLELERFALLGGGNSGNVHFAYAARHPERVGSLVHYAGAASAFLRPTGERERAAMLRLAVEGWAEQEWDLYTEIYGRVLNGWDSPEAAALAAVFRASHSPASYRLARRAIDEPVPPEVLPAIQAPALILHCLGHETGADNARRLASGIPAAQVAAIPGPWQGGLPNEIGIAAILDFIHAQPAASGQAIPAPELNLSAVRAILWTDIEEHSAMMERLGDAKGREVLREHERLTREALAAHGGAEVKAMGDGFMAWFSSAQRAVDCAIALQRAFAAHNQTSHEPLDVRAGVNAGEPISEEDDLFGASVIAAARICRAASGGEIVVADVVRQLVAGKNFLFADRGEVALRGFEDPVRLYEVRWREVE